MAWEIEYTNDIARIGHVDVIEDSPILTGPLGSEVDHLVGHWKMDDTSGTTLTDETGVYDGTFAGGDNLGNMGGKTDAVRNTSVLHDGTADYSNLAPALVGIDTSEFTISFDFLPDFDYDTSDYHGLLTVQSAWNDHIVSGYSSASDRFELVDRIGGVTRNTPIKTYTESISLRQWHHVLLSVSLSNNLMHLYYDNDNFKLTTVSAWTSTPTVLSICRDHNYGFSYGAYYIDNVKLYNGAMIYNAFPQIGNGEGLLTDINKPHVHWTLFWDAQAVAAKGTSGLATDITGVDDASAQFLEAAKAVGTYGWDSNGLVHDIAFPITSQNIITHVEGRLVLEFVLNATPSGTDFLWGFGDTDDYFAASVDSSNEIRFLTDREGSGSPAGVLYTDLAIVNGQRNIAIFDWIGQDIWMTVNGVYIGTDDHAAAWDGGTGYSNLYFGGMYDGTYGADIYIGYAAVSSKAFTPLDPFIMGSGPVYSVGMGIT